MLSRKTKRFLQITIIGFIAYYGGSSLTEKILLDYFEHSLIIRFISISNGVIMMIWIVDLIPALKDKDSNRS